MEVSTSPAASLHELRSGEEVPPRESDPLVAAPEDYSRKGSEKIQPDRWYIRFAKGALDMGFTGVCTSVAGGIAGCIYEAANNQKTAALNAELAKASGIDPIYYHSTASGTKDVTDTTQAAVTEGSRDTTDGVQPTTGEAQTTLSDEEFLAGKQHECEERFKVAEHPEGMCGQIYGNRVSYEFHQGYYERLGLALNGEVEQAAGGTTVTDSFRSPGTGLPVQINTGATDDAADAADPTDTDGTSRSADNQDCIADQAQGYIKSVGMGMLYGAAIGVGGAVVKLATEKAANGAYYGVRSLCRAVAGWWNKGKSNPSETGPGSPTEMDDMTGVKIENGEPDLNPDMKPDFENEDGTGNKDNPMSPKLERKELNVASENGSESQLDLRKAEPVPLVKSE